MLDFDAVVNGTRHIGRGQSTKIGQLKLKTFLEVGDEHEGGIMARGTWTMDYEANTTEIEERWTTDRDGRKKLSSRSTITSMGRGHREVPAELSIDFSPEEGNTYNLSVFDNDGPNTTVTLMLELAEAPTHRESEQKPWPSIYAAGDSTIPPQRGVLSARDSLADGVPPIQRVYTFQWQLRPDAAAKDTTSQVCGPVASTAPLRGRPVAGRKPKPVSRPSSKPAKAKTLNQKVPEFADSWSGQKLDPPTPGEPVTCWTLPFQALRAAGAKLPSGRGDDGDQVDPKAYIWGERIVDLRDARPGDILQFWAVYFNEGPPLRDKHSAIVVSIDSKMKFTTLNTGYPPDRAKVQIVEFNLSPENIKSGRVELWRPVEP